MTSQIDESDGLKDGLENRICEVFRSAGLPMGMALLRLGYRSKHIRLSEFSSQVGHSVNSSRPMMSRLQRLGLFTKKNLSARDVVYCLTKEGHEVAREIDRFFVIFGGKGCEDE